MRTIIGSLLIILVLAVAIGRIVPTTTARQGSSDPDPFPPKLIEELKLLQTAALDSDYAYRQTAHLCNNIGPRLTGSAQAEHAIRYVAAELEKLGCDVRLEPFTAPHWVRGVETGELVEYPGMAPGTTQKIVLTTLGGSVATPDDGIAAEVVVVGSFDELTALGRERVEGRMVLFNVKFDRRMAEQGFAGEAYGQAVVYRGAGASAAARLGAVASLVRSVGGVEYRLPHTGGMNYAADAPRIPAAAVAAEDAELIAHLAKQGRVRMKLTMTPRTLPDVQTYNVVADIKGSERPDQIVIVSGHLDSWDLGTGALDDAVGVAVAMQVAHLVKQLGLKPKRTLRIIAWMNEENGLMGGRSYLRDHEMEVINHVAAIESDVGAGHPVGFFAHVNPAMLPRLQPMARVLSAIGAGVIRLATAPVGADISPLENAGVPGFAPIQDTRTYFDYHHTAADTFDKVNPRELAENGAVMAVLAYGLACMEGDLR